VLALPQQVARAADLQVAHRNAKAGAERRELADGRQALCRDVGEHLCRAKREVGVCLAPAAADAPANLVQLRKAHAVGVLNDQRVAVAHIDPGLNDGRADQNVNFAVQQRLPHTGQLLFGHFAVGGGNACAGGQFCHPCRAVVDGFDPVIQVVYLPAAGKLAPDGLL